MTEQINTTVAATDANKARRDFINTSIDMLEALCVECHMRQIRIQALIDAASARFEAMTGINKWRIGRNLDVDITKKNTDETAEDSSSLG